MQCFVQPGSGFVHSGGGLEGLSLRVGTLSVEEWLEISNAIKSIAEISAPCSHAPMKYSHVNPYYMCDSAKGMVKTQDSGRGVEQLKWGGLGLGAIGGRTLGVTDGKGKLVKVMVEELFIKSIKLEKEKKKEKRDVHIST